MYWNTPDPKQGSAYLGEPLTLGEMFESSRNATRNHELQNSEQLFREEEHDRDIDKLHAAGGRKFDNPMRAPPEDAKDFAAINAGIMVAPGPGSPVRETAVERFNREFYEEAAKFPDLGFDPKRTVFQRWQEKAQATEAARGEAVERSGMAQWDKIPVISPAAAFGYNAVTSPFVTGAMFGGSISAILESPADIAANLIGYAGGGKALSLLRNMAYDFLGNAAAQSVLEPQIQETRRRAGLPSGWKHALENIGAAGGTGAVISAGFRGPNRAYRAATGQPGYGGVVKDYVAPVIPKPELEAIAKAANVTPETVIKAIEGDPVAFREVLEKSGAMENPEIRGMAQAAEIDRFMGLDVDDGRGMRALEQMMRSAVDPNEPMPVRGSDAPPAKLTPEVAAIRKNILEEGTGSVTDVAQSLRDNPGLLGRDAPDTAFMNTAQGLSHLSDDAFGTVRNGMASPEIGAIVANHVADPSLHAGVLRELTELGISDPTAARRALPDLIPQPNTRAVSDGLLGVQRDPDTAAMPVRAGAEVDDPAGPAAKKQAEALAEELAPEIEAARALGPADPALGMGEKFAASVARHDSIFRRIASGGGVKVAPEVTAAVHMAARPYSHILPVGTQVGNLESIRPQLGASRPTDVTATWRLSNGEVVDIDVGLGALLQARALYDRASGHVLFNAISRHELADIPRAVASGIHHETVHAWWRSLTLTVRSDLVAHSASLRVLDMQVGTVMKAIGHPSADGSNGHLTIRERYSRIYRNSPDLQDRLDQEAVAHMNELFRVGYFDDADVAPVMAAMHRAFGAGSRSPEPGESLMYAIADRDTGQSMRRELDHLGYYSHALEVARGLKQAKGTPEQMLAMLKKGGVKDSEIAATKLGELFADKPSITRAQIISHLEENRVGLKEVVRERDQKSAAVAKRLEDWRDEQRSTAMFEDERTPDFNDIDDEIFKTANRFLKDEGIDVNGHPAPTFEETYEALGVKLTAGRIEVYNETNGLWFFVEAPNGRTAALSEFGDDHDTYATRRGAIAALEREAKSLADDAIRYGEDDVRVGIEERVGATDDTKWSRHSLDPSNPTYRETVLNLPGKESLEDYAARKGLSLTPATRGIIEASRGMDNQVDFNTGHFPEPNIVGHLQSSMVTDGKGKPVYLIDQIQSDWGQKLRDGGVRDEAKIAELKSRFNEADAAYRAAVEKSFPGRHINTLRNGDIDDAGIDSSTARRVSAELRTAEASSPGNPLVNTTDQWVNITLRRAIRQAVEADADAIAIPHGDTVLTYNPGDRKGMAEFYDRIVPKNLRNLLSRLDPESAKPETVAMLETPGKGLANRGDLTPGVSDDMEGAFNLGFTVFRLTPAVKRAVLDDGQPMFALAGRELPDGQKRVPTPGTASISSRIMETIEPYLNASRAAESAGLGVERDASGAISSVVRDGRRYAITRDGDGNVSGISETPMADGPRDLAVARDGNGAASAIDDPSVIAARVQAEVARASVSEIIVRTADESFGMQLAPERVDAYAAELIDVAMTARDDPIGAMQKVSDIISRAMDELYPEPKPAPDNSLPTPLRNDLAEVDRLTEMGNLVSVCKS